MKTTAVAVPLLVVGLIFGLVWGMSMLTLKSGAQAVQGSVELLRLHVRVARLHDALLVHSRESLEGQLAELEALSTRAATWSAQETAHLDPALLPPDTDVDVTTEAVRRRPAPARRLGSPPGPAG